MFEEKPFIEHCVVDNRVFLLGLDELYRAVVKRHERDELLHCSRLVAQILDVAPADVPIEGYYNEDKALTEYFRIVRALQGVPAGQISRVAQLEEYQRLREVTGSRIFGVSNSESEVLLPKSRDALAYALKYTAPDWKIERLVGAAHEAAHDLDDISLGGLAALAKDAVVMAAVRESVVLYLDIIVGAGPVPTSYEFEWQVDDILAERADRFIQVFAELFHEDLPKPEPKSAAEYWFAAGSNRILGRCVHLGLNNAESPIQHYHWAICRGTHDEIAVQEFWSAEIWTTERYREQMASPDGCIEL